MGKQFLGLPWIDSRDDNEGYPATYCTIACLACSAYVLRALTTCHAQAR